MGHKLINILQLLRPSHLQSTRQKLAKSTIYISFHFLRSEHIFTCSKFSLFICNFIVMLFLCRHPSINKSILLDEIPFDNLGKSSKFNPNLNYFSLLFIQNKRFYIVFIFNYLFFMEMFFTITEISTD